MKIKEVSSKAEKLIEVGKEVEAKRNRAMSNVQSAHQRIASAQYELDRASETDENGDTVGDVGAAQADLDAAYMDLEYYEEELEAAEAELESINAEKYETIHTLDEYNEGESGNLSIIKQLQAKTFGGNVAAMAAAIIGQMNLAESTKSDLYKSMGISYSAQTHGSNGGTTTSGIASNNGAVFADNDNVQGATAKKNNNISFSTLSRKVDYTDKMRRDMEYALAYNTNRGNDWNVAKGRLSDEYRKESEELTNLAKEKQMRMTELWNEHNYWNSQPDSVEKTERIEQITEEYRALSSEVSAIRSKASYAETMSNELSRGLKSEERTTYVGVGGKSFTDIHSNMIQKQGQSVEDYKGTCGLCSCSNTMNALGDNTTEADVINRAKNMQPKPACCSNTIPKWLPEAMKEKIRCSNGGTSVQNRTEILNSFGYNCENKNNQSLSDICQQLENGKGAIINVDHHVLNKDKDVSTLSPFGTDHALTITGIEKDSKGNAVGLWIHDTGVCSNMGNAFYCNAADYETWRSTPNCTVQYVSKKE